MYLAGGFPTLDWQAVADFALALLFPNLLWLILCRQIESHQNIAAQHGFQIILKPLPD